MDEIPKRLHNTSDYFLPFCIIYDGSWGRDPFLFAMAFRASLGPNQPPIKWVPGALSSEVKRPGSVDDHSPSSSAEIKKAWSYISTSPIRLHGVVLN
jgi:hypothetical protein